MPPGEHSPGRMSMLWQGKVELRTTQISSTARESNWSMGQLSVSVQDGALKDHRAHGELNAMQVMQCR